MYGFHAVILSAPCCYHQSSLWPHPILPVPSIPSQLSYPTQPLPCYVSHHSQSTSFSLKYPSHAFCTFTCNGRKHAVDLDKIITVLIQCLLGNWAHLLLWHRERTKVTGQPSTYKPNAGSAQVKHKPGVNKGPREVKYIQIGQRFTMATLVMHWHGRLQVIQETIVQWLPVLSRV